MTYPVIMISLVNFLQNTSLPSAQLTPKNIKNTMMVRKSMKTRVYPMAMWHLSVSLNGIIVLRNVADALDMMRRHMVNGNAPNWNRIACIVPNSKVGTPIFQLYLGAFTGTLDVWKLNFSNAKWAKEKGMFVIWHIHSNNKKYTHIWYVWYQQFDCAYN